MIHNINHTNDMIIYDHHMALRMHHVQWRKASYWCILSPIAATYLLSSPLPAEFTLTCWVHPRKTRNRFNLPLIFLFGGSKFSNFPQSKSLETFPSITCSISVFFGKKTYPEFRRLQNPIVDVFSLFPVLTASWSWMFCLFFLLLLLQ